MFYRCITGENAFCNRRLFHLGLAVWFCVQFGLVVRLALSWVEIQSTAVAQNIRFEVFDIARSSRSSLNRHDLTVDHLSQRIGDSVRTVGHNVIDSLLQTPSWLLHRLGYGGLNGFL